MSVLYIVLPLALVVVAVAAGAFVWAARHGQFDDLQTPGMRVLHDEDDSRRITPADAGTLAPRTGYPNSHARTTRVRHAALEDVGRHNGKRA